MRRPSPRPRAADSPGSIRPLRVSRSAPSRPHRGDWRHARDARWYGRGHYSEPPPRSRRCGIAWRFSRRTHRRAGQPTGACPVTDQPGAGGHLDVDQIIERIASTVVSPFRRRARESLPSRRRRRAPDLCATGRAPPRTRAGSAALFGWARHGRTRPSRRVPCTPPTCSRTRPSSDAGRPRPARPRQPPLALAIPLVVGVRRSARSCSPTSRPPVHRTEIALLEGFGPRPGSRCVPLACSGGASNAGNAESLVELGRGDRSRARSIRPVALQIVASVRSCWRRPAPRCTSGIRTRAGSPRWRPGIATARRSGSCIPARHGSHPLAMEARRPITTPTSSTIRTS